MIMVTDNLKTIQVDYLVNYIHIEYVNIFICLEEEEKEEKEEKS